MSYKGNGVLREFLREEVDMMKTNADVAIPTYWILTMQPWLDIFGILLVKRILCG